MKDRIQPQTLDNFNVEYNIIQECSVAKIFSDKFNIMYYSFKGGLALINLFSQQVVDPVLIPENWFVRHSGRLKWPGLVLRDL